MLAPYFLDFRNRLKQLLAPLFMLLTVSACPSDPTAPSPDGPDGGDRNSAPVWERQSTALELAEGARETVRLVASDSDGDPLTFTLVAAPPFVSIKGANLLVAPDHRAGSSEPYQVGLRVSDGRASADATLSIRVSNVNRAPRLEPIAAPSLTPGTTASLKLLASDPDGDPLTLSLSDGTPGWITLSGDVMTFAVPAGFVPLTDVTVSVSDAEASVSQTFSVSAGVLQRITASLVINGGASHTGSAVLDLAIDTDAPNGTITLMRFSEDGERSWSPWIPFAATHELSLSAGDGRRTLSVAVQDAHGGWGRASSVIQLDTIAPTATLDVEEGRRFSRYAAVSLRVTASESEVKEQALTVVEAGAPLPSMPGTFAPYATVSSVNLGPANGVKRICVWLRDHAGNVSPTPAVYEIIYDSVAPVATLDVLNGRTAINQRVVPLSVNSSEPAMEQAIVVVSQSSSQPQRPSTFSTHSSPVDVDLGVAQGGRKIYVWLRDAAGNVSEAPALYAIEFDSIPPNVASWAPASGATGVSRLLTPSVTFSEPLDPLSVHAATASLAGIAASPAVETLSGGRRLVFTPSSPLPPGASVTMTVTGVTDLAGNMLETTFTDHFTTSMTDVEVRALSGRSTPGFKLERVGNAAGTLILAEVVDGPRRVHPADRRELITAFHDGSGWSSRDLGPISAIQAAAFGGDKVAVAYTPLGSRDWLLEVREDGGWRTQLPVPTGLVSLVGNSTHLLGVDTSSDLHFWDGSAWNRTGESLTTRGATSAVASEAGFAVVSGTWDAAQRTYGVGARVFDGTTWRYSTLVSGLSEWPLEMRIVAAGGGGGYLACSTARCGVYRASTNSWAQHPVSGAPVLASSGTSFALGGNSAADGVRIEIHQDGAWMTGAAVLEAPGDASSLLLSGRGGRFIAVWRNGEDLVTSEWSGTTWLPISILASGTALERLAPLALESLEETTAFTWTQGLALYARVFDGVSWSAAQRLNEDPWSGGPVLQLIGGVPTLIHGDGQTVSAHALVTASGIFQAGLPIAETVLEGRADIPSVAFDEAGRGLAVWQQFEAGRNAVFAAEFDGTVWGAAFRLAPFGENPQVRHAAGRFAVVSARVALDGTRRVTVQSYVLGTGSGDGMSLGTIHEAPDFSLASRVGGFALLWLEELSPASGKAVMTSSSSDGLNWSAPVRLAAPNYDGWARPRLVGGGAGFVATYERGSFGSDVRTQAKVWTEASQGWSDGPLSSGRCRSAVGDTTAGLLCSGSSGTSAQIYTGTNWSFVASLGTATGGVGAIATDGDSYRVIYRNQTRRWSGSWGSAQTLATISDSPQLVCNGSDYFALGRADSFEAQDDVLAYLSSEGVVSALGPADVLDGWVEQDVAVGVSGATFHGLWSQVEGTGAAGNRRVYWRAY